MLSEKPWKPDRAILLLLGFCVCFCALFVAGSLALHFSGIGKPDENSLLYVVVATMTLQGSIVVATALFLWFTRITWSEAFGFSSPRLGRAILLGFLAAVIFYPVGNLLLTASMELIAKF